MPAGRPTEGLEHIDRVHGSFEAKHRMKTIVLSLSGDVTVVDACARLGIGASRFHVIRSQAMQAAVARLEPQRSGRPQGEAISERVQSLAAQLEETQLDLRRERARAEIALTTSYPLSMRHRGGQCRSG